MERFCCLLGMFCSVIFTFSGNNKTWEANTRYLVSWGATKPCGWSQGNLDSHHQAKRGTGPPRLITDTSLEPATGLRRKRPLTRARSFRRRAFRLVTGAIALAITMTSSWCFHQSSTAATVFTAHPLPLHLHLFLLSFIFYKNHLLESAGFKVGGFSLVTFIQSSKIGRQD